MTQFNYFIKQQGNEPFIDFLKGVAILLVLYLHTIPYLEETGAPFWALMAVPLFLIVQVFHVMKRETLIWPSLKKIIRRIFVPFIIVQIILLAYKLCLDIDNWKSIIYNDIGGGGYGPGAYYPWIYLQFAFILPLCYALLNKLSSIVGGAIILLLAIGCELLCGVFGIPESLYRLLCVRYIYLIWLGYIIIKKGIHLSLVRAALSAISICFLTAFYYYEWTLPPLFFASSWNVHRWICYFYVAFMLLYLLYKLYSLLPAKVLKCIYYIGKCSYEIFMVQMLVISIVSNLLTKGITGCPLVMFIIVTWLTSITIGILWYKIEHRIIEIK